MSAELIQGSKSAVDGAGFVDDKSAGRMLHMAANARNLTTIHFQITATSPGAVQGMGADSRVSLPGGAIPVALRYVGRVKAATTGGTITIGIDTTSAYFLSGQAVDTVANGLGQQTPTGALNLFAALALVPLGQSHTVTGYFSETATSLGAGPFYCSIDYYLPDPA